MKKVLKLAAIFLLIAGGLFLAFNLDSIFNTSGDNGFSSVDGVDIKEQCDQIREDWEKAQRWDESLYQKHHGDIEQNNKFKQYTQEGYIAVTNTLHETVANLVSKAYRNALLKDNYSDGTVKARYADVKALSNYDNFAEDARIKSVVAIHNLYLKVYTFVNSRHTLSSAFNRTGNPRWRSYQSQRNGVLSTASSYRNNALYHEISQIPGFQDGLDESKLTSLLDGQKNNFFQSLSDAIIACYESIPATPESVSELNEVVNQYSEEYATVIGSDSSHGSRQLNRFVRDYERRMTFENSIS